MLGEGGEKRSKTNINYLLEEYGMSINSGQWRNLPSCWTRQGSVVWLSGADAWASAGQRVMIDKQIGAM